MARNDITGDELVSRVSNDEYRRGWDAIFGKKKTEDDRLFEEELEALQKMQNLNDQALTLLDNAKEPNMETVRNLKELHNEMFELTDQRPFKE